MKHRASTARPEYTILEKAGVFKVYDRNQHYRCSFPTRAAAQTYIDQRLGKVPTPATTDMTQAAASAA
jgi:hypothetical protein